MCGCVMCLMGRLVAVCFPHNSLAPPSLANNTHTCSHSLSPSCPCRHYILQGMVKAALQRLRDAYSGKARELADQLLSLQEQHDSVGELLGEREEENRNAEAQVQRRGGGGCCWWWQWWWQRGWVVGWGEGRGSGSASRGGARV